jgi:glycosyltransferase involved in cell wall biosynthesis
MERKFSVIIPTMFYRSDILCELLETLYADTSVYQVIVINNLELGSIIPKLPINDKLLMCSKGRNLYVNPSWNLGVTLASEDYIALLNDDIVIPDKLFTGVSQIDFDSIGILGACHPMIEQVENPKKFAVPSFELMMARIRPWGFGIFMAMKKSTYKMIPEEMLIWCGDDYLFHQTALSGKPNVLIGCPIKTKMSATSDNPIFDNIKNNDKEIYETKYKIK